MDPEERKTRIPTRYKLAAERARRDKSLPNRSDTQMTLPTQPRRSSIPRLQPRPPSPRPDVDDFDKLFDDIVDGPVDIDVSLLNNKVDDPDKVEDRFEEIIHDYDEGIIKPITLEDVVGKRSVEEEDSTSVSKGVTEEKLNTTPILSSKNHNKTESPENIDNLANSEAKIEKSKSKIPMLKRRSEPEIDVPKTIQRVIQNKTSGDRIKVQNAINKFPKDDDAKVRKLPSRIAISKRVDIGGRNDDKSLIKDFREAQKREDINKNPHDVKSENVKKIDDGLAKSNNTFEIVDVTPIETLNISNDYKEINIEPNSVEFVDKILETTAAEPILSNDYQETTIEASSIEFIDAPTTPIVPDNNEILQNDTESKTNVLITEIKPKELTYVENNIELIVSPVKIATNEDLERATQRYESPTIISIEKDIISKVLPSNTIRGFNYQDPIRDTEIQPSTVPVEKVSPIRLLDVEYYDVNNKTESAQSIHINEFGTDAIHSEVLPIPTFRTIDNQVNPVMIKREAPISLEINDPVIITQEANSLEVDDETNNSLTSIPYNVNNPIDTEIHDENTDRASKNESNDDIPDTAILKGNVSRIINRLSSKEDKEESKKEIEDVPKPKTVFSKIAMFEHQEPVPRPKLRDLKAKPADERTDFKPKIINEVLKPQPRTLNHNDSNYKDYNPVQRTNSVIEVNVQGTAVSNFIEAEDVTTEEAIENEPYRDYNTDNDEYQNFAEEITKTDEFEPNNNENNKEDAVFINHIDKTAQFDTARRREDMDSLIYVETPTTNVPRTIETPTLVYEDNRPIDTLKSNIPGKMEAMEYNSRIFGSIETPSLIYEINKSIEPLPVAKKEKIESPFNFMPKESANKDNYFNSKYNEAQTAEVQDYNYKRHNRNDFRSKDFSRRFENYNEYKSKEFPSLDYDIKGARYNNEQSNLKKAKSVAELDLGDSVKGRVHDMIVRMKSVDRSVEKKDVISAKERPRKKSVSEKIALFEGKLSVHTSYHSPARSLKPAKQETEDTMSPSELQARVSELVQAKMTYGKMTDMTYVVLNNGREMPVLSIGTALLDKQLTPHVVAAAIDLGYRAIDAAWVYGNEREVGEGIRMKIEDGTVQREDLFIVNKLWSTFHKQELVEEACKRSLDAMGLEYFDLYLIHNPMSFKEGLDPIPKIASVIQYSKHDYLDAWYGMEQLVGKGWVRSIGVSNFNSIQVQRVVDKARVKPTINMVESHPYLSQQRLDDFCSERNIKLFTYGVLGSKGTPNEIKGNTAAAIDDPLIQVMAAGLGVTPAQLLVRYQIECGHTVVTKASSGNHLWDNLQALTFTLTEGQVDAIRALNRNKRTFIFKGMGDTHKNYPFNIAF